MVAQNKSRKHQSNMALGNSSDFKMVKAIEKSTALAEQFQQGLARCMQKNADRRDVYWILFHSHWEQDHTVLRMTFAPWATKPPKMLNTICHRVDNIAGRVDEEWALSADAPAAHVVGVGDKDSEICVPMAEQSRGLALTGMD